MPRRQMDHQTIGPCPSIAALTRHAEELRVRVHPRGTRFKRAFVVCFHCERSSRKVSGELLPGKNLEFRFSRYL